MSAMTEVWQTLSDLSPETALPIRRRAAERLRDLLIQLTRQLGARKRFDPQRFDLVEDALEQVIRKHSGAISAHLEKNREHPDRDALSVGYLVRLLEHLWVDRVRAEGKNKRIVEQLKHDSTSDRLSEPGQFDPAPLSGPEQDAAQADVVIGLVERVVDALAADRQARYRDDLWRTWTAVREIGRAHV